MALGRSTMTDCLSRTRLTWTGARRQALATADGTRLWMERTGGRGGRATDSRGNRTKKKLAYSLQTTPQPNARLSRKGSGPTQEGEKKSMATNPSLHVKHPLVDVLHAARGGTLLQWGQLVKHIVGLLLLTASLLVVVNLQSKHEHPLDARRKHVRLLQAEA